MWINLCSHLTITSKISFIFYEALLLHNNTILIITSDFPSTEVHMVIGLVRWLHQTNQHEGGADFIVTSANKMFQKNQ